MNNLTFFSLLICWYFVFFLSKPTMYCMCIQISFIQGFLWVKSCFDFIFQGHQGRGGKDPCWFLGCCIYGVLSQREWGNDGRLVKNQLIHAVPYIFWHRFTLQWKYSWNADGCGGFQADHFGDGESGWKWTPGGEEVCCDVNVYPGHQKS